MGNRRRWSLDVIAVWAGRRPGDFVQRSLNGGLPVRDGDHAPALYGKRVAVRIDVIDAGKSGVEQPVP